MRFTVVLPDGTRDHWGIDVDAAYEVERSDHLRVIEFDPMPDDLHHVRIARVYADDGWVDIQHPDRG